jgi:hypothetical protein
MGKGNGRHTMLKGRRIGDALNGNSRQGEQPFDQAAGECILVCGKAVIGSQQLLATRTRMSGRFAQPFDVTDRRSEARQQLRLRRAGLEAAGQFFRRAAHLVGFQPGKQFLPAPQHAEMRAKELVGRAGEEIAPERLHVRQAMRHELNGIDIDQRAGFLSQPGERRHVVDRAGHVAGEVKRQKPRALAQERREIGRLDTPALTIERKPLHRQAEIPRQQQPWGDVALMVHPGEDDFIARPEQPPDGAGQMQRERRHALADDDLAMGGGAQHVRHRLMCIQPKPFRALRAIEKTAEIVRGGRHGIGHRVDHLLRHQRAGRVVEIDRRVRQLRNGRKAAPHLIDRESWQSVHGHGWPRTSGK